MTPALSLVATAAMLFSAGQVLLLVLVSRRSRLYRRMGKFERIRTKFAAARGELILLAADDKLSSHSETFKHLYRIQTVMMHRFDAYPHESGLFWRRLFAGKLNNANKIAREAESWNDETKAVAARTADALRQVWIGCMPFGTALLVAKRMTEAVGIAVIRTIADKIVTWFAPAIFDIKDAEEALRRRLA